MKGGDDAPLQRRCQVDQQVAAANQVHPLEFLDDKPLPPPVQIFATDLSDSVSLAFSC